MTTRALLLTVLAACGTNGGPDLIAGFDPPPVKDGYTRYVTPAVHDIKPGDDVEYCQWVAPPAATTQDVLDFTGAQSAPGHHVVLYATTLKYPVGESHICTEGDMLAVSFVGGVGGEGLTTSKLPAGIYSRLPAGQALMADTHWLNETDQTLDGQAVVDVEFAAPDPSRTIADLFANNGDTFSLPPATPVKYDVSCTFQQDLQLAMAGDHMHSNGTSAYSEVIHPDGTKTSLVADPTWNPEQQFNPTYTDFGTTTPMLVHAGDTYHTHCEWLNQTQKTLSFPDEMCAGFAFYFPGQGEITCDDGSWAAANTASN